MTSAVTEHLPNTVHLHCLWHLMQNIIKKSQGTLGQNAIHLPGLTYACACYVGECEWHDPKCKDRRPRFAAVLLRVCCYFFLMECQYLVHVRSLHQRFPWVFVAVSVAHGLQAFDGVWEKIMEMVKDSAVPSVPQRPPVRVSQTVRGVCIRA